MNSLELPEFAEPLATMDKNGNVLMHEKAKGVFLALNRLFIHCEGRYVIFDNLKADVLAELSKKIWVRK